MAFYYALVDVAGYLGDFSNALLSAASQIQNVYLIGTNLATKFIQWGVMVALARSKLYQAASAWRDVYNELKGSGGNTGVLSTLLYWADDLINFIRDPDGWIRAAINRYFPKGLRLLTDPIGEIVDIVLQYTGFSYDFVFHPTAYLTNFINNALGAAREIINDADGWFLRKINQLFPQIVSFIRDPDGWLINKIHATFPTLSDFIKDPDKFIIEHLVNFLERFVAQYGKRLAGIADKIIHLIY